MLRKWDHQGGGEGGGEEEEDMQRWLDTRGLALSRGLDLEEWLCAIEAKPMDKGGDERKREQLLTRVFGVEEGSRDMAQVAQRLLAVSGAVGGGAVGGGAVGGGALNELLLANVATAAECAIELLNVATSGDR